jgi:hypothetical protein
MDVPESDAPILNALAVSPQHGAVLCPGALPSRPAGIRLWHAPLDPLRPARQANPETLAVFHRLFLRAIQEALDASANAAAIGTEAREDLVYYATKVSDPAIDWMADIAESLRFTVGWPGERDRSQQGPWFRVLEENPARLAYGVITARRNAVAVLSLQAGRAEWRIATWPAQHSLTRDDLRLLLGPPTTGR